MSRITKEARLDGMRAAGSRVTRLQALGIAQSLPVQEGDAYLAGYYDEIRRLNAEADREPETDLAADRGDWEFHRDYDQ
jgi:hypothetical protein